MTQRPCSSPHVCAVLWRVTLPVQAARAENEALSRALCSATQEVAALKEKAVATQQQAQQLKHVKQQVSALAGDWQAEVHTREAEVSVLQQQLLQEKELTERLKQQQQQQQQQQALQLQHYAAARARVDELERQVTCHSQPPHLSPLSHSRFLRLQQRRGS
jgi:chromosome segregation ATPase